VSDVAPEPGPALVLLSELVGREVVTEAGRPLGRLRDLTVALGTDHPTVRDLVVADREGLRLLSVRDGVEITDGRTLRVHGSQAPEPRHGPELPLEPHQLMLARDVVDTQVVDLQDYRLSRVSDLYLACQPDGAMEVAAADVGLGAVLRRMGLGWLGSRLRPVVVDWDDLHLTSRRGHEIQLGTSTAAFRSLDSDGLAELLTRLSTGHATELIQAVPPRHAAAALHRSHPATGRRLVRALRREDASRLIAAAHPAHAARLAELHAQRATAAPRRLLRTSGWRRYRPPPASSVGPAGDASRHDS
jgi:sporulation protein YlmC with PRC-barrel domain